MFIIILDYITVYDPSIDPFGAVQGAALSAHLNPLDDFLLEWLQSGAAYISKLLLGSQKKMSFRARSRLERVLTKVHNFYPKPLDTLVGLPHSSIDFG